MEFKIEDETELDVPYVGPVSLSQVLSAIAAASALFVMFKFFSA